VVGTLPSQVSANQTNRQKSRQYHSESKREIEDVFVRPTSLAISSAKVVRGTTRIPLEHNGQIYQIIDGPYVSLSEGVPIEIKAQNIVCEVYLNQHGFIADGRK
jgi:hemin uptake protein HemP